MTWSRVRGRYLFREVNERGFDLPLASATRDGGVEFRSDLDFAVWNPDDNTSHYKRVRPHDFVIGLRSFQSGIGYSNLEGLVSPAYTVLRPISSEVHGGFFKHLFKSDYYISRLDNVSQGIRQGRTISTEDFYDIQISVPSVSEQRAIAHYLDTESARIDALISKKRQLIKLLEERADSVVFNGIRGRLTSSESPVVPARIEWLGTIPQHYGTPWLGAYHTTQLGKMLNMKAASGPEQYPYIKNANVKWDHFDLEELPTMTFDVDDRRRCELRPGDVVVCEGGEVGRSAVWSHHDEIFFQKALHRVRPVTKNIPRFLMYCLWSAAKLNVFAVEGNQSTIVHLTGEKLREHRFPWPPLDEQDRIVSLIDAERGRVDEAVKRLERQVLLLSERRQALITSVVTGEIPVPEIGM